MTVEELITELSKYSRDTVVKKVTWETSESGTGWDIESDIYYVNNTVELDRSGKIKAKVVLIH